MKKILTAVLLSLSLIPTTVALAEAPKYDDETICLAKNIYYEARGEPLRGKLAVAWVTLNRVASGKFRDTICKVVYQKNQFSWTSRRQGKPKEWAMWLESLQLAYWITQQPQIVAFEALYFHATNINPGWKKSKLETIGNHHFYI
jgi:spore germination cell wall hydrolase CwlJ-like protein